MYFKMAINNVKKSFKDYRIYFLTLTLAVCIFYSFNSIESQKALLEMSSSQKNYVANLSTTISYISVFISIILGSLILYANNFLIKRRNKELGIYMILGMGKNKISKILVMETFIVGVISLVTGLILGFIVSQGLSIFVSNLFEVAMREYRFIVSFESIQKTILYFGIMFLLVMLFNTFIISKYKVIDLLTISRKNEDVKIKNPLVYLFLFILCIVALSTAYKFALETRLDVKDIKFVISIVLGVFGTGLFFFSVSGFSLYILKKNKKIYFKGLNIFIVKQINSKVKTNFVSMTVICLMLFITISILSTGLSFKNSIESSLEGATPYDASASLYYNEEDKVQNIKDALNNIGFKFNEGEKYAFYSEYSLDINIEDLSKDLSNDDTIGIPVHFIKLSEYNKNIGLNNREGINLNENEVLILSNYDKVSKKINSYLKTNNKIDIKGKEYTVKNKKAIEENLLTYLIENNMITIVVNDEVLANGKLKSTNLNVNFAENNKEKSDKKYRELFNSYKYHNIDYDKVGFVSGNTKTEIYEESKGMTTTILFIGIYIGVVFLISSMAVLALQQLSEANDSVDRYIAIKKIGASKKDINKSIFIQIFIYFTAPVLLALIHSIVGINVASDFISIYGESSITTSSIITAVVFLVVYGVYFYTTYVGYKNVVNVKLK